MKIIYQADIGKCYLNKINGGYYKKIIADDAKVQQIIEEVNITDNILITAPMLDLRNQQIESTEH